MVAAGGNSTGSIAFAAELTATIGPNAGHTVLPFGREILNLGLQYNVTSYTFNPKFRGLYFFAWSQVCARLYHTCSYLAVNGVYVHGASMYGNLDDNYSIHDSQTAVVELEANDNVNVRLDSSWSCKAEYNVGKIIERSSSFMGFLIRNLETV